MHVKIPSPAFSPSRLIWNAEWQICINRKYFVDIWKWIWDRYCLLNTTLCLVIISKSHWFFCPIVFAKYTGSISSVSDFFLPPFFTASIYTLIYTQSYTSTIRHGWFVSRFFDTLFSILNFSSNNFDKYNRSICLSAGFWLVFKVYKVSMLFLKVDIDCFRCLPCCSGWLLRYWWFLCCSWWLI